MKKISRLILAVILALLVYTGTTVLLAIIAHWKGGIGIEDYLASGRDYSSFILIFHMFATMNSSFTFLALPGASWAYGFTFPAAILGGTIAFGPLLIYYFGKRAWVLGKEHGLYTSSDIFRKRFDSRLIAILIGFISMLFYGFFVVMQTAAAGKLLVAITGGYIPYTLGIIFFSAIVLFYTFTGGQRAVGYTDALQGALFLVILVIVFALVNQLVGGFESAVPKLLELEASNPAGRFMPIGSSSSWSYGTFLSLVVSIGLAIGCAPHIFRSMYFAKDLKTLRTSVLGFGIASIVLITLAGLIGVFGRAMFPTVGSVALFDSPDKLLPALAMKYMSLPLVLLVMVGVLTATRSTVDSLLMAFSAFITTDILKPYTGMDEDSALKASKLLLIPIVVVSTIVALQPPALIASLAVNAFEGISIMFPLFFGGLYWERCNKYGGGIGVAMGVVLYSLLKFGFGWTGPWGITPAMVGLFVSSALTVAISLATPKTSEKVREDFFGVINDRI